MYHAIKGEVSEIGNGFIIMNNGGIEYKIFCSQNTIDLVGEEEFSYQKLFTVLEHTEKAMALYGFIEDAERTMFNNLVKVDGVGAKVALCILSALSVNGLTRAVKDQDLFTLTSVKGIGPKVATKLIHKLHF